MANYMREVAKLLGLELEEEFRIEGISTEWSYRLSDKGLIGVNENDLRQITLSNILKRLLTGEDKIIKLPWKPKEGETYYSPAINDEDNYWPNTWLNDNIDKIRYRRGLVFKTKEEAINMAEKMLAAAQEKNEQ